MTTRPESVGLDHGHRLGEAVHERGRAAGIDPGVTACPATDAALGRPATASSAERAIQASPDGSTWSTLKTVTGATGGGQARTGTASP
ncbi:hypothetical protein [Nonomuraea sp. CA-141351]|uniref:hypothetical protein n=1 Tax=Nonomuraea sp. CA-141351 TaxID=3239996 RepID=UPI003D8F9653